MRRFSPYENLRDLVRAQSELHGDRTFLFHEDDGREYSFRTLDTRTTQVANVLHELGCKKGARIALLLDNSPDFVFAFLGVMKGGFIAVPMNIELAPEQLRFQLEDCGASAVVTSADHWDGVSPLLSGLPGLASVLVTGKSARLVELGAEGSHIVDVDDNGADYRILDFTGCLNATDGEKLKTSEISWWDEAQIVYTGHHLHQPRGAILQHRQFMTSARWLSIWLGLDQKQRFMSVLPLFHANTQVVTLFTPLQLGASVVLSREFSASRVWKAVERYKVTTLSAVPAMLGILADRERAEARGARAPREASWPAAHESPGTLAQRDDAEAREQGLARAHDISSLERVLCGAAPLPTAVQKTFEQVFLVPVIEGYSMAETTCFATLNPGNGSRRLGSVGVAVGNKAAVLGSGVGVKPLKDDWGPMSLSRMNPAVFPTAEIGEPGEICVWGENVLKEYYHRPKVNPQAFAGGWFHTGDVGYQDADGFFYVGGPKEEEIQRGGVKFMPREVDEVLFHHQQVEQAATIGLADSRGGSMVTTWIVMRKGTFPGGPDEGRLPQSDADMSSKKEEILAFLSQHLSEKKRPTSLMFARSLPSDRTGKTRIIELRRLSGTPTNEEE
ncbi:MAG: acyl--CoA ligase [Planctomycetes bacterium]|nr:acyl--CoA ligase [Planctomycetota bacterium]